MKKFITAICIAVAAAAVLWYLMMYGGFYIDFFPNAPVSVIAVTDENYIYWNQAEEKQRLIVKGVELDSAIPGAFSTDYKVREETYLHWLCLIAEMGANTVRVNTIFNSEFYDAFYRYNTEHETPLYLIQGVWVEDYVQNTDQSANSFVNSLKRDCKRAVDAVHGRANLTLGRVSGGGSYRKDVSAWTIGYIIGSSWYSYTVSYTDYTDAKSTSYDGKYFYTAPDASAFETILAEIMDETVRYESSKYKQQRLISFMNEPATDPFDYEYNKKIQVDKVAEIDAEKILVKESLQSGYFASYKMYRYITDFVYCLDETEQERLKDVIERTDLSTIYDGYIDFLNTYHTMPVLIAGYGYSSARGAEREDGGKEHGLFNLTEKEQGLLLAETYTEIVNTGCAGAVISSFQDNWSRTTWNTWHAVDSLKEKYWSDYQTPDGFYGLLSFEPGKEKSCCYVDGELSDWEGILPVFSAAQSSVSMQYDEQFLYFLIYKRGFSNEERLYIPIDTTPKSGSNYASEYDVRFEREADFLILIDGRENSRITVQERYDVTRMEYGKKIDGTEPFANVPDKNSPVFSPMRLVLQKEFDPSLDVSAMTPAEREKYNFYKTYETGKLTYGNANPLDEDYNSLADFIINGDYIELRIPWQLLNFSNPSEMKIHDDYYERYGVEEIKTEALYVGLGISGSEGVRIPMERFELDGWGKSVSYHERLKQSYYIMQALWRGADNGS